MVESFVQPKQRTKSYKKKKVKKLKQLNAALMNVIKETQERLAKNEEMVRLTKEETKDNKELFDKLKRNEEIQMNMLREQAEMTLAFQEHKR